MKARIFSLVVAALVVVSLSAVGQEFTPIGDVNVSASGVSWQTKVQYQKLVLTVTAPNGAIVTREFVAGTTPAFRAQDLGRNVADGQYTYELRALPIISDAVKSELAAARAADDDAAIASIKANAGIANEMVQAGGFSIHNGSFVTAAVEPPYSGGGKLGAPTANSLPLKPKTNDVVTADDEIIQGSLCVGLDCVVNESFGFDTIRLKENNTRIKFQDTSTSSGFPNVNWQLTANDSNSGGLNKFSIDDITNSKTPFTVIAAAPTNSLFVASNGKVGFGNSAPVLNLHITATDTPAIRQEQTNGGGFTAQTWDIGANEANWFVRDVTGGSRLPLRIRPGAPTSSIDINASGKVGIGTASPSEKVTITTNSGGSGLTNYFALRFDDSGTADYTIGRNGSTGFLQFAGTQTGFVGFTFNGNIGVGITAPTNPIQALSGAFLSAGGAWTNASSRDFKENICDLDGATAMETLRELNPVTFTYKVDKDEHHVGFIAEDVPDLVSTKDRKSLSAMDIVAVLTKAVQEQQKTIDELKAKIDELTKKQ